MSVGITIQARRITLIQNMFALYSRGGLVLRRGFQLCLRAQHSIWAVERVSVLQGGGAGSSPALPRTPVLFCTFLFGPKIEVFILHANAQNQVRRYDQSEVGVRRGGIHDGTWPGARPPPGNPTQKTQLRLSKTCLKVMSIWHLFCFCR